MRTLRSRPPGMTLIELLLAMTIAVLLMGIVFSIYRAVLAGVRAQSLQRGVRSPAAMALEMLGRDLARTLSPAGETNAVFVLEAGSDGSPQTFLSFVSAAPVHAGEPRVYDVFAVQYMLEKNAEDDGYTLTRRRRILKDNDEETVEQEKMMQDIKYFSVEVFDGSEWHRAWKNKSDESVPQAARIKLAAGDEPGVNLESEILIPAGRRIPGSND